MGAEMSPGEAEVAVKLLPVHWTTPRREAHRAGVPIPSVRI